MRRTIHPAIRDKVRGRFSGRCGYCGESPNKIQIDHIHPVQSGGTDEESNLMPSCFSCNNYKTSLTVEQFRREIAESVRKARDYSVNFRFAERFGLVSLLDKPVTFHFEKDESK